MNVRRVATSVCALVLLATLQGCKGDDPDAPGEPPAPAAPTGEAAPPPDAGAAPAAAIDPAAPPLMTSRGAEGSALPEGHPPLQDPGLPAGHPPLPGGGAEVKPPDPMSGRGAQGIVWKTPAGWVEETPSSALRRGQYRIPGPGGDAELAVFYFGAGQGGDPTANAQRWASQFKQPGGGDPLEVMKTQTVDLKGTKVLLVETTGTYVNTAMNPADVGEKPNYALLGAVVPGPDSNWFFKMTGPQDTVKAQRDKFIQLLQSIQKGA